MKWTHTIALLWLFCSSVLQGQDYQARSGDLIFQTSMSAQSLAIQRATGSPYSHMGIVFVVDSAVMVCEALDPVQYTPLQEWAARGEGGKFVVKRLKRADSLLTESAIDSLRFQADAMTGKRYDHFFQWSDERIYCSELVWKVYRTALGIEIGAPQRMKEFNLKDPLVAAKLEQRFGRKVPLDELVISPARMFDSELLMTIYEK